MLVLVGCTRDNPAFDDCEDPDRCLADESGTGDGDPGDGDGDGDPGDGDPGDGDPGDGDPGDGDGESGDGDPGDGDGDDPNMLPSCPQTVELKLPVVKDTFLVAAPEEDNICIVGWDLQLNLPKLAESQLPCEELTFGGSESHWVCSSDGCSSVWLGRFNVGGFADQAPKVVAAQVEFWAQIGSNEPFQASLHPLEVEPTVFGPCGDWSGGGGVGQPVGDCETSWTHAAHPHTWQLDALLGNAAVLGVAGIPAGDEFEHHVILPIANHVVEGWMINQPLHIGAVLRSQAFARAQFIVRAKESRTPPLLVVDVCSEL